MSPKKRTRRWLLAVLALALCAGTASILVRHACERHQASNVASRSRERSAPRTPGSLKPAASGHPGMLSACSRRSADAEWVREFGPARGTALSADHGGAVYVAQKVDALDKPTTDSTGSINWETLRSDRVKLARLDSGGAERWSLTFHGGGFAVPRLAADGDGVSILLSGTGWTPVGHGVGSPGPTGRISPRKQSTLVVLSLQPSGRYAGYLVGEGASPKASIDQSAVARDGKSVVLAGSLGGRTRLGTLRPEPTPDPTHWRDFIASATPTGSIEWMHELKRAVTVDAVALRPREIVVAGRFTGTTTIGRSRAAGKGIFVAALSRKGAFQWVRTFQYRQLSRHGQLLVNRLAVAPDGSIYASGTACHDGSLGEQRCDGLVVRWNAAGHFDWVRRTRTIGSVEVEDIALSASGAVIVAGQSKVGSYAKGGTGNQADRYQAFGGDFERSFEEHQEIFSYVQSLDSAGKLRWSRPVAAGEMDAVATGPDGRIFVAGSFRAHPRAPGTGYFPHLAVLAAGEENASFVAGICENRNPGRGEHHQVSEAEAGD